MSLKLSNILPPYGYLTFSLFIFTVISGIFLALVYEPMAAYKSIALIIIQNPYAAIIRAVHYWSAQLFFVLSIVHIIDHLLKNSEIKLKRGVWLRTVLSIGIIVLVMLTGFFLRGDGESMQAILIFQTIIKSIPFIGSMLSYFLTGFKVNLIIIYVNHIATATILIWLFASEHSKVIFSNVKSFLWVSPLVFLLSILFIPGIHQNSEPIIKSPWYFVGMQEFLHWIDAPFLAVLVFAVFLIFIYFLPLSRQKNKRILSLLLLFLSFIYFAASILGLFLRGENWEFKANLQNAVSQYNYYNFFNYLTINDSLKNKKIRIVKNNPEACMSCHQNVAGFTVSHSPDSIGCSSCHLGNPLTLNKNAAHQGIVLMSGNLSVSERTCNSQGCHLGITERVNNSLMNTMSGVVSVDKYAFGEIDNLHLKFRADETGFSSADKHLRGLCIGCHIGIEKKNPGPVNETSRGGGCSACHLVFLKNAQSDLMKWKKNRSMLIKFHPSVSINVDNSKCFGCHSRSGRISTNFEGWHETLMSEQDYMRLSDKSNYRLLDDGRVFRKVKSDIHFKLGLECIDCHSSYEIMGDGINYAHKEESVKSECEDCHSSSNTSTIDFNRMDSESRKIIKLRNLFVPGRRYILQNRTGIPLVNVFLGKNGKKMMRNKNKDTIYKLKSPSAFCGRDISGHKRLSCQSCHTSWSPQCIGCHTEFNPKLTGWDNLTDKKTNGAWMEKGTDYFSDMPTLGIIEKRDKTGKKYEQVSTFVPGMIMTLRKNSSKKTLFKRLFAPAFSHTIQRESRDCKSCHNSSLALGYGRGKLLYDESKAKWSFIPSFVNSRYDNLPLDAWIPFLKESSSNNSTRPYTRPFSVDEQKRILTVGACFVCHNINDYNIIEVLRKFKNYKQHLSKNCILPRF